MAVRTSAATQFYKRTTNLPAIARFSVCGWSRIEVDPNRSTGFIALGPTSGFVFYEMGTGADGTVFSTYNGSVSVDGTQLTVGAWNFVALVCDGTGAGNLRGYKNGVLDSNNAGNGSVTSGEINIATGNDANTADFLNGQSANWMIFDKLIMTPGMLKKQQTSWEPLPEFRPFLNGWYPLLSVNDVRDYSGHGNHLAKQGSPVSELRAPVESYVRGYRRKIWLPTGNIAAAAATIFSPRLLLTGVGV